MTTPEEEKDDAEMTMEEREQWLRDRGVKIENPGKKNPPTNSDDGPTTIVDQMAGLDLDSTAGTIQFVCIPHDDTKPLRTLRLPKWAQKGGGDSLPEYVKSHFADSKSIDATLLQEQATKQFVGGQLENFAASSTNISAAAMNAVAAQGSVETFPLVHPAASNSLQGVYIYLDEVGMLKKLPPNRRATQLATACGYHPPPQFYGDVFVGRVRTTPILHNLDFVAGLDTDPSSAAWLQRAPAENVAWQQEINKATGKEGALQPAHTGTEGEQVREGTYSWTQEDDDLEITVPFDNETTTPPIDKKQLKVKFTSKSITVTYGGESKLSLKLYAGIDVDACTWTIEGGNKLIITCEKANPGELWPKVKGG